MNYFWAFCVGGAICVAGQLLIDLTGLTPARILTGYVVAGVVLSAIGWYAPLAEFAGCGATVPLLGFGHLLAKGVRTALQEEGAVGLLIAGGGAAAGRTLPVRCENGVRYTVPTTIRPDCAGDTVTLRFRVGGVYKNKKIAVYRGTDCIYSRKRPVLAPGEMETVRLKAELLRGPGDAVTVTLEEG